RGGGTGYDDVGRRRQGGAEGAELLAHRTLDAVASDGAAVDLARHGKPQPRRLAVAEEMQGEEGRAGTATLSEHAVEVCARADARLAGQAAVHQDSGRDGAAGERAAHRHQAVRRLRPLARRRARILRPSAVAMRARKPWSRLRLRLLGW